MSVRFIRLTNLITENVEKPKLAWT